MKCLEKDRNRRYETANGLAQDIERYLSDEPVQACAPSAGYRLRKFVRRNKGAVLAVSLVLSVLFIGMIGITWSMIQTTRAKADLAEEAKRKDEALTAAQKSEKNANDQLFLALVNQARALRFSGHTGRAFDSLNALAKATALARTLQLPEDELLTLRNEAIACMSVPDVRRIHEWSRHTPGSTGAVVDPSRRRYTTADDHGDISIHRMDDDQVILRLKGPGLGVWSLGFSPDGQFLHGIYPVNAQSRPDLDLGAASRRDRSPVGA
jgi:hypothetical protein